MTIMEIATEVPLAPPADIGPLRLADWLRLPDEPRCQLIRGRLYLSPAPHGPHQVVAGTLYRLLDDHARRAGGLALFAPVDVVLAEHSVVQPDLLYLSPERRGRFDKRCEGAPDLVVEILSPGSARMDRGAKLELYAESGVREYWIVDLRDRLVDVLVLRGERYEVRPPVAGRHRSEAVPGLVLDPSALWRAVAADLGEAGEAESEDHGAEPGVSDQPRATTGDGAPGDLSDHDDPSESDAPDRRDA